MPDATWPTSLPGKLVSDSNEWHGGGGDAGTGGGGEGEGGLGGGGGGEGDGGDAGGEGGAEHQQSRRALVFELAQSTLDAATPAAG